MARRRNRPSETPYERRIRRYLETHPGATRQEARGHRLREGERSEYARRTAGAQSAEERASRAGHRGYRDLLRALRDGDIVGIDPSLTRDAQGRWRTIRITVLDQNGRERTFTMRKVTDERVRELIGRMSSVGAISSPTYAPARLLHEAEGPELDAEAVA